MGSKSAPLSAAITDVPGAGTSGSRSELVVPVPEPLIMQIIVRRDLLDKEGWGLGPLMAQTAHATAAVLHETRENPNTQAYLADLKGMRKIVMQTSSVASLTKLSNALSAATPPVPHHLWIEQPENEPTCVAIAPNRKEPAVKKALSKASCRVWQS
ncbi:peptidyl-tRNA hydrolase II [Punctularia strigosozonata HHB-11173 SS5]|uniref:peptidyl-tRNA hydrolase II n=1 Tax=Punctularia strigosozonata (strain HHB-11173) TaxID=741275 RepID=UPI000441764A|nr:peptidyl-tRNA hydrolase II [Punctularia strigosozonata HHB-11173 SS5]EIN06795.1 peptidyl-tRNA hydrolase II [Punctularia strigosozonata HHB-11173 SS5]